MFKRYDPDAKLVVYYAAIISTHAKLQAIGPNELLLALTWRQHAPDCEFRKLKDHFQEIWAAVGLTHLPLSNIPYRPSKIPANREAKRILAWAAKEADNSRNYWIDIDHIMRGMFRENGPQAQILSQAGWTYQTTLAAGELGRISHPTKPAPVFSRFRWQWRLFFGSR